MQPLWRTLTLKIENHQNISFKVYMYSRIYKLEGILMLGGDLKSASNFKVFFIKFVFYIIHYLKAEIQFKLINFDQ